MRHRLTIDPVVAANGACWQRQAVISTRPPTAADDPTQSNFESDQKNGGESRSPNREQTIQARRPE